MKGTEKILLHPRLPGGRDGAQSWGPDVEIAGVIPFPRTSTELDEGGTVIGENIFIPGDLGAAIKSTDNVTLRGVRYALDGKPGDYRKAGRRKGVLLILKGVQ
jgi:hypothetical protein